MQRLNFREIEQRFTHIDGRIMRVDASFNPADDIYCVRIVLSFYPWWEHPAYLAARRTGLEWAFDYDASAEREVVIEAIEPLFCEFRRGGSGTDIVFLTEHPLLWQFEDTEQIFCNSDVDTRALCRGILERGLPYVTPNVLFRYIDPYPRYKAPYAIGSFPRTLFSLVKSELLQMGVALYINREPDTTVPPVALSIDDEIAVVAKDFFVNCPEFEHRPEWFRAGRATPPG